MHIREMERVFHQDALHTLQEVRPESLLPPVALNIALDTPVTKPRHLIDGVRRVKQTVWYRVIRKRGLRFVPLGYQAGMILLVVGTAASLGTAHSGYKRMKSNQRP